MSLLRPSVPLLLGGPVLQWELLRSARRLWPRLLRDGYACFLLLQLLVLLSGFRPESSIPTTTIGPFGSAEVLSPLERERRVLLARSAFAAEHFSLLLQQQLILFLLLTPVVTAGAIGVEKERDTLTALFATELTARAIVVGKFLGRLALLAQVGLSALPLLVVVGILGDVEFGRLALAAGQAAVLVCALAAVCLVCSVWTRRTADAILACYSTIVIGYFFGPLFLAGQPPDWLDPVVMLEDICDRKGPVSLRLYWLHLAAWSGVTLFALGLAMLRLRAASLAQLESRTSRWLWLFRPRIGDNPVLWRERHVIGLAPLPWLRKVPTWMGLLGVFSFAVILAGTAVHQQFLPALQEGDFTFLLRILRNIDAERIGGEVTLLGMILIVLGSLIVGVRCADSVAEEKRRKTWEDLILTPLSMEEITQGKVWGVLRATPPYVLAYAVPMFWLAAVGGVGQVIVAVVFVVLAAGAFTAAGWFGMAFSMDVEKEERRRTPARRPQRRLRDEDYPLAILDEEHGA